MFQPTASLPRVAAWWVDQFLLVLQNLQQRNSCNKFSGNSDFYSFREAHILSPATPPALLDLMQWPGVVRSGTRCMLLLSSFASSLQFYPQPSSFNILHCEPFEDGGGICFVLLFPGKCPGSQISRICALGEVRFSQEGV